MGNKQVLIIITGHPGSGKTTLGKKLASKFKLPYIYKDGIKEQLFDSLGWHDREWAKKLGKTSLDLLYYFAESILTVGGSAIVETNFYPEFANKIFLNFKNKYSLRILQIRCYAKGEVLCERFEKRATTNERHPGHADLEDLEKWRKILMTEKIDSIDISDELYDIDTTDPKNIDYDLLNKKISQITKTP